MSLLLKQKMWHVRPTAEAYFETSTLRLKDFDTILDFKAWNSRTLFAAFSHHGILLLQGFIFKNNWPWSLMSLLLLPPFLRDAGPADFLPSFCSRFISNMALHYWFFRILLLFWMPHLTFCTQVIRGFSIGIIKSPPDPTYVSDSEIGSPPWWGVFVLWKNQSSRDPPQFGWDININRVYFHPLRIVVRCFSW